MSTKLTLSVEKETIEKAKRYAQEHNRSLSEIVTHYLEARTEEQGHSEIDPEVLEIADEILVQELPEETTDILRSERLRVTCFVLLPEQSLPEHYHPPYGSTPGKEETLRVLLGETRIYVPGEVNNPDIIVPAEKERYYTVRREIRLRAGSQHTVEPPTLHWFQGGPEGSVNLTIQNRVDETRNVFTDPRSTGCPIRLAD